MRRWWWRNSSARWRLCIPDESISAWVALRAATFIPCGRCEETLQQTGEDFPALLEELRTYLGPETPGQLVRAIPGQGSNVPISLLGSSGFSAQLAAMLGLPFAFAAHFAPEYLYAAASTYLENFRPSDALQKPYLMVAVQVIAAETDAAARRLFTTPQQRFLRLIRNQPVELLPPVDSMESLWQNELERAAVENKLGAAIVGSTSSVKAGLEKLISETMADEVIAVTDTYDHEDRLRSYRQLADVASRLTRRPQSLSEPWMRQPRN